MLQKSSPCKTTEPIYIKQIVDDELNNLLCLQGNLLKFIFNHILFGYTNRCHKPKSYFDKSDPLTDNTYA